MKIRKRRESDIYITIAKMMEESGSRTEYRTLGSKGLYLEMMKR